MSLTVLVEVKNNFKASNYCVRYKISLDRMMNSCGTFQIKSLHYQQPTDAMNHLQICSQSTIFHSELHKWIKIYNLMWVCWGLVFLVQLLFRESISNWVRKLLVSFIRNHAESSWPPDEGQTLCQHLSVSQFEHFIWCFLQFSVKKILCTSAICYF